MGADQILSPQQTDRTITRLAYQIVEQNQGGQTLEFAGIRRRGTELARTLARRVETITDRSFGVTELDVTPYRDDVEVDEGYESKTVVRSEVDDRDLILVDDVLFTGRTARAALDAVVQHGRPRSIQLVILVDRGHREYPIQPDFRGRLLQTKHKERVRVATDEGFAVYLEE